MIGKPVALIQIPNQRLFGVKAAARYLGIHEQTLRKMTDLGELPARKIGARRVYRLEDLDRYIDSLPQWYDRGGENPA
ncbi:MAG: helix-turn-helix domain-containing protein [Acidobacteria bacterium]|nr:helix-turn-helix domain-containing protein [Acidobacteriota bacterium]